MVDGAAKAEPPVRPEFEHREVGAPGVSSQDRGPERRPTEPAALGLHAPKIERHLRGVGFDPERLGKALVALTAALPRELAQVERVGPELALLGVSADHQGDALVVPTRAPLPRLRARVHPHRRERRERVLVLRVALAQTRLDARAHRTGALFR